MPRSAAPWPVSASAGTLPQKALNNGPAGAGVSEFRSRGRRREGFRREFYISEQAKEPKRARQTPPSRKQSPGYDDSGCLMGYLIAEGAKSEALSFREWFLPHCPLLWRPLGFTLAQSGPWERQRGMLVRDPRFCMQHRRRTGTRAGGVGVAGLERAAGDGMCASGSRAAFLVLQ